MPRKTKKSGPDKLNDDLTKVKKAPRRKLQTGGTELECCFEKDAKSGILHMTIADVSADVTQGDEKLGHIRACVGGGIEVQVDDYTYFMSYPAIWDMVSKAHQQWKDQK